MPFQTEYNLILNALKKLGEEKFGEFSLALTDLQEEPRVFIADVEKASRAEVAKLLQSRFDSRAVDVAARSLRAVGCNRQAEELEREAGELVRNRPQSPPRRRRSRSPLPPAPSRSSSSDAKSLLSSVRPDFVELVSEPVLDQLLDRLLRTRVLNPMEMENAKVKDRADKARAVVDAAIKKGSRASSALIEEFCDLDPLSDLCHQLKP